LHYIASNIGDWDQDYPLPEGYTHRELYSNSHSTSATFPNQDVLESCGNSAVVKKSFAYEDVTRDTLENETPFGVSDSFFIVPVRYETPGQPIYNFDAKKEVTVFWSSPQWDYCVAKGTLDDYPQSNAS